MLSLALYVPCKDLTFASYLERKKNPQDGRKMMFCKALPAYPGPLLQRSLHSLSHSTPDAPDWEMCYPYGSAGILVVKLVH